MSAEDHRQTLASEHYVYEAVARAKTTRTVVPLAIYGEAFLAALENLAANPHPGQVDIDEALQIGLQDRKAKLADLG